MISVSLLVNAASDATILFAGSHIIIILSVPPISRPFYWRFLVAITPEALLTLLNTSTTVTNGS